MDTLEFARAKKRMCDSYRTCQGCPFAELIECSLECTLGVQTATPEDIAIVEKWDKEYPVIVDCYNCGACLREEDALYDDFDNPYCHDCFEKKTAVATYSGNRGPKNCIHPLYDMDGNCLGTICQYDMTFVPRLLYDAYHLDGSDHYSSPHYFTNDGKYIVKIKREKDDVSRYDVIRVL